MMTENVDMSAVKIKKNVSRSEPLGKLKLKYESNQKLKKKLFIPQNAKCKSIEVNKSATNASMARIY